MAAASDYLEQKLIGLVLRGEAFTPPAGTYVALHTASPGDTGANEVTLVECPSYVRQDAAKGGAVADGWIPQVGGVTKNAQQLIYPVHNGVSPMTITHFSVWDAATGGNMLIWAQLSAPRTLNPTDVFVVDVQKLTASVL